MTSPIRFNQHPELINGRRAWRWQKKAFPAGRDGSCGVVYRLRHKPAYWGAVFGDKPGCDGVGETRELAIGSATRARLGIA